MYNFKTNRINFTRPITTKVSKKKGQEKILNKITETTPNINIIIKLTNERE